MPAEAFGNPGEMIAYAGTRTDDTEGFILQLGQTAAQLVPPTINPVFPQAPAAPAVATATEPTIQNIIWTAPGLPQPFSGTLNIDQYMPAPFDADPPVLSFPAAPPGVTDVAPTAPPVNIDYVYPDLNVSLPAPPALLSLNVQPFSGINMPTIDVTIPELTAVAPSVVQYQPGSLYTSSLLTTLSTTLQSRITNGGTGLPPAIENAIWDRGREREYRQSAAAIAELERMETLGYAFPPGVYNDSRLKIQTEMGYVIAGYNREVAIEQAKLEQSNILKALDTATALEGSLITYNNNVEQRAFEASRFATQAGIEIYNGQVRAYAAIVDAYRAKVQVYEAQIRAEIAKVEAYKTEIAAEQAKAQINTALVEQYRVQATIALSAIQIYEAQIKAIQTKADIEKIKVQIFGEQVRGYTARIGAYTAQVEGFRASVQAEGAKQEAYKSQVQAYGATVDAAAKQIEAKIREFEGLLKQKEQEWEGYKAAAVAESSRAKAIADSNSSAAEVYRSTVQGLTSYNETLTKQWQVTYDQAQRTVEIGVSAAKANGDLYMTTRSLSLDAAKVGAQVNAQLGAAALNAINWSSSVSTGFSTSKSTSDSTSQNYSQSVNTGHTTSESTQHSDSTSRQTSDSNINAQYDNTNTNSEVSTRYSYNFNYNE